MCPHWSCLRQRLLEVLGLRPHHNCLQQLGRCRTLSMWMLRQRQPRLQQLTSDWNKHHWQRCDQYYSPSLRRRQLQRILQVLLLNSRLPLRLMVDSGVGIHCHWRMEVRFAAEVLQRKLWPMRWKC